MAIKATIETTPVGKLFGDILRTAPAAAAAVCTGVLTPDTFNSTEKILAGVAAGVVVTGVVRCADLLINVFRENEKRVYRLEARQ